MEICVFTEPRLGATYDELLAVARTAEAAGFTGFFRSDHYLAMHAGDGPGPGDAWITLAGLARETSSIRLGTLVTSATFRLPGPTAISVAGVDAMSGGRVEFGIGAGWFEAEHTAYGIPFPSLGGRFDRLEEYLAVVTGLWSTPVGDRFAFDGKHFQLSDSPALPKPIQQPGPPIIIGGGGKKRTPALAARYASEFNVPWATPEDSAPLFRRVEAACVGVDRRAPITHSAAQVLCCGVDEASVARRAEAIGRDVAELRASGLTGSPAELVDKIGRFAEVGASRIYLQVVDLADLDHIELVGSKVLPQL
ncbi:TIGR03560 family F420-dependent LLM class oxidoreductase [Williamsia sp. CHRR-6]|uniref:TIGR03560 family F420-dependent LLM class oxidoreductase n=1 Tax=Williamsia sp. CHRR-6 TaxID=2835871 RepID=UPI001BDB1A3D|nr:TIGR03560 family F420-dependent LLM class oxidoreductase [Williamsia sp. CHRR-6]MBT0567632.1 TIGR03560 family F420-dependent LLM class oxidoreductase [Williamsia sp. CHRR-6]